MVTVWIDETTRCLINNYTGDVVATTVERIKKRSVLKGLTKKNDWYTNWPQLYSENEIYALHVKGSREFQGLVALHPDAEMEGVIVPWMCAAPHNNPLKTDKPFYRGVGGHLFAIAVQKSSEYGFGGVVGGKAANRKLLEHYCNALGATWIGTLDPNYFILEEPAAKKIAEVYDYEWE